MEITKQLGILSHLLQNLSASTAEAFPGELLTFIGYIPVAEVVEENVGRAHNSYLLKGEGDPAEGTEALRGAEELTGARKALRKERPLPPAQAVAPGYFL